MMVKLVYVVRMILVHLKLEIFFRNLLLRFGGLRGIKKLYMI